jgi:hypothetical protein
VQLVNIHILKIRKINIFREKLREMQQEVLGIRKAKEEVELELLKGTAYIETRTCVLLLFFVCLSVKFRKAFFCQHWPKLIILLIAEVDKYAVKRDA